MKLSIFRSRSDGGSPSPRRESKLFHMLSPGRSKSGTPRDLGKVGDPPPALPELFTKGQSPININAPKLNAQAPTLDGTADSNGSTFPADHAETQPPQADAPDSHVFSDNSAIDERDMHRRLMDVESSFLPEPSPNGGSRRHHSAGTLAVFGESTASSRSRVPIANGSEPYASADIAPSIENNHPFVSPQLLEQSPETYQTPATRPYHRDLNYRANLKAPPDEDELDYGDDSIVSSSHDQIQSSPAAAAAMRYKARALSAALVDGQSSSRPQSTPINPASDLAGPAIDDITRTQSLRNSAFTDSLARKAPESNHEKQEKLTDQERTQTQDGSSKSNSEQRPGLTDNRLHSKNSSVSSAANQSEVSETRSEATVGADPAAPARSSETPSNVELSRVPSFGSMASSMSGTTEVISNRAHKRGLSDTIKSGERGLERLDEEERAGPQSPLETPRAMNNLAAPSETVLAQHVRDIKVPNTVARDFRDANQDLAGDNTSSMSTPFFGRAKNTLTLKEQNSRVDKLSKENFDLKLKIHYLHQALQNRSDEGIKDLYSKNAQLQTDLLKSKKENQTLRKRLQDLERPQNHRHDSHLSSCAEESEDDLSSMGFRQGQTEEEILYLRDRVQFLEEENEKLRDDAFTGELQRGRLVEHNKMMESGANADIGSGTEESGLWREALEREIANRQRVERKAQELRSELSRLKQSQSPLRRLRLQPSQRSLDGREQLSGARSDAPSDQYDLVSIGGTTLVEQLKHENATLRRDLGAQTSMLTSRNRERERLQQEIENLKLFHRRGEGVPSVAGDSILDRSISRQSGATRESHLSDPDREHYESVAAKLRDENAALRLRGQDMQRDLSSLNNGVDDLRALQTERDDALRILVDLENESEIFREDALNTINGLEELVEEREREITLLGDEIDGREKEAVALRQEIKAVSQSLVRLADDRDASQNFIRNLEQDLTNANGELEVLEKALREVTAAKERLEVQAESSRSEISFLRDEQEGDKIKIGDLQTALRSTKDSLKEQKERLKELQDLEAEEWKTKEEIRELRKLLSAREIEASDAVERVEELESGLRAAFGSEHFTRSGLLKEVTKLQQDLEHTVSDLDEAKVALQEKDHVLKRNNITPEQHSPASPSGTEYRSQLQERNTLLRTLYARLSTLCGPEWTSKHLLPSSTFSASLTLPSLASTLDAALNTLESNILSASRARIRATEKDLSQDLRALEHALGARMKRMDKLEKAVSRSGTSNSGVGAADLARLKDENKALRRELKYLKAGSSFALPGLSAGPALPPTRIDVSPSRSTRSVKSEKYDKHDKALNRHTLSSAVEFANGKDVASATASTDDALSGSTQNEQALRLRLKEMEKRLKAEREARLLDRSGARKRLEEGRTEYEEVKRELERQKLRRADGSFVEAA